MKYRCKICGEIIESDTTPEVCPKCKQTDCFEVIEEAPLRK